MNIFVLSKDPIKAAQLQCDKHVVKMIVESAQMLSTTHRLLDGTVELRPSKSGKRMVKYFKLPDSRENVLYKNVHETHPCTLWTMENSMNYSWHYDHFIALCNEYNYRYGKIHSTDTLLRSALIDPPNNMKNSNCITKQPLAMKSNPECMMDDVVESYRAFYQTKQDRFKMAWTERSIPEWFQVA
jgi:hypothetical protein